METIIFHKPTKNIQRAFGLFSYLEKLGYQRKTLNPSELFIVVDKRRKEYYSTSSSKYQSIDIPTDYQNLIK